MLTLHVAAADFGLPSLRCNDFSEETEELAQDWYFKLRRAKVYRAPELRDVKTSEPTAPADVYAFAIILVEIATREDPYGVSVIAWTSSQGERHHVDVIAG